MSHCKHVRRRAKSARIARTESDSPEMDTGGRTPQWVQFSYEPPIYYSRPLATRSHEVIRNGRISVVPCPHSEKELHAMRILRFYGSDSR